MTVVPIKGHFEGWRALLAHVMEDEQVERIVVLTFRKDGSVMSAHHEVTREQMAYGSLMLGEMALRIDR